MLEFISYGVQSWVSTNSFTKMAWLLSLNALYWTFDGKIIQNLILH